MFILHSHVFLFVALAEEGNSQTSQEDNNIENNVGMSVDRGCCFLNSGLDCRAWLSCRFEA